MVLTAVVFFSASSRSETLSPGESAESLAPDFKVTKLAGPFEYPWSLAFLPGGGMLVTDRPGGLHYIAPGSRAIKNIAGLPPILTGEQAGLMDVVLDPDFAHNRTIYLSYAHGEDDSSTVRVLKAQLDLDARTLAQPHVIFEAQPYAKELINFGGRMAFDRDGFLFLTLGDRYEAARAQDLSDDWGSVIRMRADGSFPDDNPFIGKDGARPGIWSYGHRNPQGLAIDAQTGQIWEHEHGPMGGDEVNLVQKGRNYGWPAITYGVDYDGTQISALTAADGMEQPVYYWVPSIAPSGLAVYQADRVPQWRGSLWAGAMAAEVVVRLSMAEGKVTREERFLKEKPGRIRDVRVGPDGFVYMLTDDPAGALYRIEPTPVSAARATCEGAVGPAKCQR
ncbi:MULTISPECIES: PQQ-dependent sugar dehydrogenase [Rhodomicrobium]|uniref:PQQ-dependent sugar dehydrogenase n=1 Tax=Rhodomicrobium TaxID=1068 RepID=UPI002477EB0D|nr:MULTISPECIES: PQQ-dependent sugar dehydrogenase [Rhodomicrobium]